MNTNKNNNIGQWMGLGCRTGAAIWVPAGRHCLPPETLPEFLRGLSPWLPTTPLTDLLHSLLTNGQRPDRLLRAILELLADIAALAVIAAHKFRWA